jgi:hypothetical protein
VIPLDTEALLTEARRRAGLDDFGTLFEPFRPALEAQVRSMRDEAQLNEAGRAAMVEGVLSSLVNVLRMAGDLKRHPEILDEPVRVAALVVGLPRTGSTMLHRMLATHPQATAPLWWEVTYLAPFPGEVRGDPSPRQRAGRAQVQWMCDNMPDLISIHPMDADAPDEDVMAMEQVFVGTAAECRMNLPSYVRFIEGIDKRPVYRFLRTFLQYLQWQSPQRAGRAWVLKAPAHLTALPVVLDTFPEASVVMTHRDPVAVVPSFASLGYTLTRLGSDRADPAVVGRHWSRRWQVALQDFMATRAGAARHRFLDVMYEEQVRDPFGTATMVMEKIGLPVDAAARRALQGWVDANPRDGRARHRYTPEMFGLTEAGLKEDYAFYRDAFGFSAR